MLDSYHFKTNVIGRTVVGATFDSANDRFILELDGGQKINYSTEGECCSRSWIEHLELPEFGGIITDVDEPSLNAWDEHACNSDCGHESLAVYHTRFRTTKGDIVLEYRTDSNGYYGGWLYEIFLTPADPEEQ